MIYQDTRSVEAPGSEREAGGGEAFGIREAIVCGALGIGFALLGIGLVRNHMWQQAHGQLAEGLLTNIAILAALCVVLGVAAIVVRRWARHILLGAFAAALLIAFGWTALVCVSIAFISFSIVGEWLMPAADRVGGLSLKAALGAGLYLLVLSLAIHFRVNTPTTYGVLLMLPWLRWRSVRDVLASCQRAAQALPVARVGEIAIATLLLFVLALHLSGAGLPERYADGVLYHIVFAQTIARLGYWPADFHDLVWALMPAGTDWLFNIGNMTAGESGAKAMSFLVFLLLLGNLFEASRRLGVRPAAALLVVTLFASTPMAFIETTALFIEHGLALFMFAALAALLATEYPADRRVLACMILLAAAVGSKLHAFAVAGPLGIIALWIVFTQVPVRKRLFTIVLDLVVLAVGCAPYIYAYAMTRNPVFPFFNAVFHSPYYPLANFVDSRWVQPPPYDLFYHLTFHTELFGEFRNGAFGFYMLALVLAGGVAAIFVSKRALGAFALGLVYIFAISRGSTYARYLYPGIPLVMLGVASLFARDATASRYSLAPLVRSLSAAGMLLLIALNLVFFSTAGWPLSQNFWSGLFDAQKWQQAGDASLAQLAMNRRVSGDGLPAPRELLFNDAVPAGLAGTPLPVNWYNQQLVKRFVDARSVDDIAKIIRDYGATHASFRLEPNGYGYDAQLVARALEQLGDPIERRGGLTLYRLHPDVWLGRNLLGGGELVAGQKMWQVAGDIEWTGAEGARIGGGASLQQAPAEPLKPGYFHRLVVRMNCSQPEQNLHVAVVLEKTNGRSGERIDDFPPCNVTGDVTRTLDFITPDYPAIAHVIVDNASAAFLSATLREGYPVAGR